MVTKLSGERGAFSCRFKHHASWVRDIVGLNPWIRFSPSSVASVRNKPGFDQQRQIIIAGILVRASMMS
jgi:hypothetical protein